MFADNEFFDHVIVWKCLRKVQRIHLIKNLLSHLSHVRVLVIVFSQQCIKSFIHLLWSLSVLLLSQFLHLLNALYNFVERISYISLYSVCLLLDLLFHSFHFLVVGFPMVKLAHEILSVLSVLLSELPWVKSYSYDRMWLTLMNVQAFLTHSLEVLFAKVQLLIARVFQAESVLVWRAVWLLLLRGLERGLENTQRTKLPALACVKVGLLLVGMLWASNFESLVTHFILYTTLSHITVTYQFLFFL